MNKDILVDFIDKDYSISRIANVLSVSIGSVRYWLKKYNLSTNHVRHARTWTDEQLVLACKNCITMSGVITELGLNVKSGNYSTMKKYINILNIDISHFDRYASNRNRVINSNAVQLEDVMVENSTYSRGVLKKRVIKDDVISYMCAVCGINSVWNGQDLVLILDHINGVYNDHRVENLRFVCPNCNSQLPMHCGKNNKGRKRQNNHCVDCGVIISKKSKRCMQCSASERESRRITWPTVMELEKMLENLGGNYSALARSLGVSDNGIRKHIKTHKERNRLAS